MKWTNSLKDTNNKKEKRERDNSSWPTSIKDIKSIMHKLPKQKEASPNDCTGEFYLVFQEEMILILYTLSHKLEAERAFPVSFY